jgi:hypothetical protein
LVFAWRSNPAFGLANPQIFTEVPLHRTIRITINIMLRKTDRTPNGSQDYVFRTSDTRENFKQRTARVLCTSDYEESLFSGVPGRAFGSLTYERSF